MTEYIKIIRPLLTDARFNHSIEVAKSAVILANKYGADPKKAETAGILHDIMKDTSKEEQLKMIDGFGIILSDIEKITPKLWHQILGAAYVQRKLGIEDEDIINAIRYHTSGRKNMSILEKVVFIADFISEDRDYSGVEEMRVYAENSLEEATVEGVAFVIKELAKKKKPIIIDTFEAYNEALLKIDKSANTI